MALSYASVMKVLMKKRICLLQRLKDLGWPSGLRRCVQVAVSPGGVGSNPTPDKPAFWPAGQTRPSSTRHCLAAHTPRLPPPAPPPQEPSVLLSASFLPSWLQLLLLVFLPPRLPVAHPRPPSHSHGPPPPAAPKHTAPRRLASPPRVAGAPTSAGERPTRSRSLACTSAPGRSPSGRHPVLRTRPAGPPALPSHTEAAEPPPCPPGGCCVPSTLLRLAALAGPHLPAARQGHVPPSLPAGQRTPVFLAPVRPGKGAPLGREQKPYVPVQPAHRRPAGAPDLPGGSRCPGRSQALPERAPCLSRQSPSQEPLCQRAPPHQHHHPVRAGPRARGPPEHTSRAHTPLGRDPAVAERNVGARPQRPRSACACT